MTRTIELDVSAPWQPPEDAPPRRTSHRALVAALVALAALLLPAASARSASLAPELIVQGSGVQSALSSPDAIFVLHQPNQGVTQLDAYRLTGGPPLWSRPFGQATGLAYADERTVVLSDAVGEGTVAGIDAATGALRWQRSGFNTAQSTRHAVVVEAVAPRPDGPAQPAQPAGQDTRDLAALNPDTGDVLWSFSTRPGANAAYLDDGDADFLVELAGDGTLRLYDLDTGVIGSTVKLAEGPEIAGFDLVGGLLLAVQGRAARLSAYDIHTGRLVWYRPAVRDGFLQDCGVILCLGRDSSISGIDWRTGQEVWRLDGYVAFQQLDRGHLLATRTHELDRDGALIDAVTGRVTGRVPGWVVLAPDGGGVVVWRPDAGGGALIGRLDRGTGRVDVFGTASDWFDGSQCVVDHGVLACRGATRLSVWQVPRP